MINKPLVLIGFKSVGKSVIGQALAEYLKQIYIDLDKEIELRYNKKNFSCRDIMQLHGEPYFRALETETLAENSSAKRIQEKSYILSVGGGTPIAVENREYIKQHHVIHITAPLETVFTRIISQGIPAFFSETEAPIDTFTRLWREREILYKSIADYTVNNTSTIECAVRTIHALIAAKPPE